MEQAICPDCGHTVPLIDGRIRSHGLGYSPRHSNALLATWRPPFCKSSGQRAEPRQRSIWTYGGIRAMLAEHRPLAVVLGLREE